MEAGFTGTQNGMTLKQKLMLVDVLDGLRVTKLHHGDCIGADEEAHILARYIFKMDVVVHPPDNDSKRAFCKGAVEVRDAKPYLERNDDIAEEGEVLIAAPKEYVEIQRSGTWATIRYARKKGKQLLLFIRMEPLRLRRIKMAIRVYHIENGTKLHIDILGEPGEKM